MNVYVGLQKKQSSEMERQSTVDPSSVPKLFDQHLREMEDLEGINSPLFSLVQSLFIFGVS